jgi:hypothetical protein
LNLRFEFEFEFELREKLVVAATGTAGRAGGNCFTEREKREREINNLQNTHCLSDEERERERDAITSKTYAQSEIPFNHDRTEIHGDIIYWMTSIRFDLI